jgi:two-component system, sensor histidine kinase PdtaS
MAAEDVLTRLRTHERELRLRLATMAGDGREPDEGSDAALLLEALQGAAPEDYEPRFAASARQLAEQGGRLEVRLESLLDWQRALADALAGLFENEPRIQARAERYLSEIVLRIAAILAREYQAEQARLAARSAERAHRGMTRLQALQRINAAANSTLDLDQTLETTARAVAEEMSADLCAIFLFDDVSRELRLHATSGPLPRAGRQYTVPLHQGYSGWVAERGQPLNVEDAGADERFRSEASAYPLPYRGLLAVPIIFFTVFKLEGVIAVQTREPHRFSDEEVSFLEIVAGHLAMNIENGRLHEQTDEELRRKVHELSTLYRVSSLVTSTLVLDNVLSIIVAQAVQLSGADRSILFELDAPSQRLRAVASHGWETAEIERAVVPVGQCCAGRVAGTDTPSMLVDCMRSDEGCFLRALPEAIGDQHAVLCVPLSTGHGPLGALCIFSGQRHIVNEHQRQLVVTFANVAAIAMENARLFTETRQGLRTKEALLREMHHRVKNNLQQVASILNMQRRRAKNAEVEQILLGSVERIQGIAATHDLLSSTQLGVAPVDQIARKIVGVVRGNLVPPQLRVHFAVGNAPYHMPTEQATTLAIILNELIANAIEHGFEGREQGEIRISASRQDRHIVLRVADDGRGLPEGFAIQSSEGLGLSLVRRLAQSDLRGSVAVFAATGSPDLAPAPGDLVPGAAAPHLTDPRLPAITPADADAPEPGQPWTIVELRFPLVPPPGTDEIGRLITPAASDL